MGEIYRVKDQAYPDQRIVGWVHSHPGRVRSTAHGLEASLPILHGDAADHRLALVVRFAGLS